MSGDLDWSVTLRNKMKKCEELRLIKFQFILQERNENIRQLQSEIDKSIETVERNMDRETHLNVILEKMGSHAHQRLFESRNHLRVKRLNDRSRLEILQQRLQKAKSEKVNFLKAYDFIDFSQIASLQEKQSDQRTLVESEEI